MKCSNQPRQHAKVPRSQGSDDRQMVASLRRKSRVNQFLLRNKKRKKI
jgi:hypothetical protein